MTEDDLAFLPTAVLATAMIQENSEVLWPFNNAPDAINALADRGRIILGLEIREYQDDGMFYQIAWSSFETNDDPTDVELGRRNALEALVRENDFSEGLLRAENWVCVTWATKEWVTDWHLRRGT